MKTTMKALGFLFASPILVLAVEAHAIPNPFSSVACTYVVPDRDVSGDNWYGPTPDWSWCTRRFLRNVADLYGMSESYWDDGFGWDDACNMDKPFGRFTAARVAMDVSSPWSQRKKIDSTKPFIDWAALWSTQWVDDLRASCAGEDAIAYWKPPGFLSGNYIVLNVVTPGSNAGFFYGQNVAQRAAIFLHEVSHWAGDKHVKVDGQKLDQRWGKGAFTTEIIWLSDYASMAFNAPRKLQCSAERTANALLDTAFVEDPGFEIDHDACTL